MISSQFILGIIGFVLLRAVSSGIIVAIYLGIRAYSRGRDETSNATESAKSTKKIGREVSNKRNLTYNETEYAKVTKKTSREVFFDKGNRGEFDIYRKAVRTFEDEECYWLFNVYVPKENGKTTEIDVIFFHETGIYIIESKNYSGWIFGHESQDKWTQCLCERGGHVQKNQFYNPIQQNQTHVNCYRRWLGIEYQDIPVYSVVLFGSECELKKVTLISENHFVGKSSDFPRIVRSVILNKPSYSNMVNIRGAYNRTYPLSQMENTVKLQHVENIRYTIHTMEDKHDIPKSDFTQTPTGVETCPVCRGMLVRRVARRGPNSGQFFWGCSNFPRCRFTKKFQ